MNRIYYLPIVAQRVLQKHNDTHTHIYVCMGRLLNSTCIENQLGIVKWQPLFKFQIKLWQNENHLDQGEFYKVLLYEKLSSKNTLFEGVHFDRSGLPLQRVYCFQREIFSGGTSKEVRPLERGDSPRMSRRLRPAYWWLTDNCMSPHQWPLNFGNSDLLLYVLPTAIFADKVLSITPTRMIKLG